jgi:hypothetical protein
MFKKLSLIALSVAAFSNSTVYAATSAPANANQTVTAAIAATKVSDLEFGSAVQGDIAKTVAPAAVENAENASFNVTGQASTAYTITLPASITMTGPGAGIVVNAFASFPAAGANGMLSAGGAQLLLVGGTRAALPGGQVVGAYTAPFTVDVVY